MKKILLAMAAVAAAFTAAQAQETVKTLYSGEPKEVTWESTLTIPAEQFAEDVNVGNYIYITFSETTDVIEIKANGEKLPGSIFTTLGDNATDFKAYITTDMLAALREYGLEICGAKFTVTGVSVCNDGFVMPQGAIWGGYFWVDSWTTMDLFKEAFDNYKGQRYMDIYLSDEASDNYIINVLTQWGDAANDIPEVAWAKNDQITHAPHMATVDLKDVNVKETLAATTALKIQGDKGEGNPFNITAVALREDPAVTGIGDIATGDAEAPADIYNLQGVRVMSGVTVGEAMTTLPAGLYIAAGKKFLVK